MAYVTLVQAKAHLYKTTNEADADITLKIDQASGIVADYLKGRADSSWSDTTNTPGPVQAATLLVLGHLYKHRGDDMAKDAELWEAIARLLMRFRDPALA